MPPAAIDRLDHVRFLLRKSRWVLVVLVGWTFLGLIFLIRAAVFPSELRHETAVPILSELSLDFWLSVAILLLTVAIIEGSFQTHAELRGRIAELESRYARADDSRELRDALGSLMAQGTDLMTRCNDETKPVPVDGIIEWEERVENYLRRKREPAYLARFQTCSSWPTISAKRDLRGEYVEALQSKVSLLERVTDELEYRIG
jgi:hypothetical protein